jgi:hypothetical protein
VAFAAFPPGPAHVRIQLFNSAYLTRVSVPDGGREITIVVPDGLIPVHVTDRVSGKPIASAQVTWVGGGSRAYATATANGDALLEAAGTGGGTLTISAPGYQTLEGAFEETPETSQEVSLTPLPSTTLRVRVVGQDAEAIAGAVVELASRRAGDPAEFVATDSNGIAAFVNVSPGTLRLNAFADGFAGASVSVPDEARAAIVIALARR